MKEFFQLIKLKMNYVNTLRLLKKSSLKKINVYVSFVGKNLTYPYPYENIRNSKSTTRIEG